MAEKRLFSKKIVESDAFLDMKPQAQLLYFHLCMNADDDGFVNNPKKIALLSGISVKFLVDLIDNHFLIDFESKVVVIKHWWINNTKRSDSYHPTNYQEYYQKLMVKSNKSYTMYKINGKNN